MSNSYFVTTEELQEFGLSLIKNIRAEISQSIENKCKASGHDNYGDGYAASYYYGRYGGTTKSEVKAPTPKVCGPCSEAAKIAKGEDYV